VPVKRITLAEFLRLRASGITVADVRSEKEFASGHIPGARNLPILINEHRAIVGTEYKHNGQEAAIRKGWDLAGPSLGNLYRQARKWMQDKPLLLHCWRGGMRSEIAAWVSAFGGGEVLVLEGGYKVFRHHVLEQLQYAPSALRVVGGKTGSGKTEFLQQLAAQGEQILDLEGLAHHKGSSFGALGQEPQPSQEQFENNLVETLSTFDLSKPVWVEFESRTIGRIVLPEALFHAMLACPMTVLDVPDEVRIRRLLSEYGHFPVPDLESATLRIAKRLGGQHAARALEALHTGDLETWMRVCLQYYDKTYSYGIEMHMGTREFQFLNWE
jgi:tRNA 2-selenouridine synthase